MDPNEIIRPGTPQTAWITPDGKQITTDRSEAQKIGATHEVAATRATFADGRIQWLVFTGDDHSLAPGTFSPAGSPSTDPDQQRIWNQQKAAAGRKATRTYTGVDPKTGRPAMVTEYETGDPTYEEIKPPTDTRNPDQREADRIKREEAEREAAERKRNRELPPHLDPRDETDAQRAARADATRKEQEAKAERDRKEAEARAERNRPGAPTLKPDGKGGTIAVQTMPDGTIKTTPLPGVPSDKPAPDRVTVDGTVYERNPQTGQYAPAPGLPQQPSANPTAQAPRIPNMVLGASQEALRQYKKELQDGVASGLWTQKWADDRWAEAYQLGQLAVQEHSTLQREAESQRAAEINLAGARNTTLQNGINSALEYVGKMNGLLPEGSNLGGQAFAALLGLQMLQMHASGLSTVDPRARVTLPAAPTGPELANPAALAARSAAVSSSVQAAAAPTPPNAIGAGAIGNQPAPGAAPRPAAPAAPATPAAPASPAPVAPAPPAPAPAQPVTSMPVTTQLPHQAQGPNPTINPATGEPTGLNPLPEGARGPDPAINPVTGEPTGLPQSAPAQTTAPMSQTVQTAPGAVPSVQPNGAPDFGQPGMRVLPQPGSLENERGQPGDPVYPLPPGEVTRTMPSEYPIMANYPAPVPMPTAPTGVWDERNPTGPPPPGATYPLDPRPAPVYDREGVDRTNDALTPIPGAPDGPWRSPPMPWPQLEVPPGTMARYPILDQYSPPMLTPAAPTPEQPAYPAVRAAQIAATPPWRLSPEDLEWAEANGYGQQAWSVPGRTA